MKNIESEKTLERLLKSMVASELKGECLKMLSTHVTGLPDRICLIPGGKVFFAEIKTTDKKPKKIQLWMHRKIRDLGFRVEVIETSEQIRNIIKEYSDGM